MDDHEHQYAHAQAHAHVDAHAHGNSLETSAYLRFQPRRDSRIKVGALCSASS